MPRTEGIRVRHGRRCRSTSGGACNCKPSYEASVFSARDGKKIRKTFPTQSAARQWRADAMSAMSRGGLRAASPKTFREAAVAFVAGTSNGTIRNKKGLAYKPSVLRGYQRALENRVLPEFGGSKLTAVTSADLQSFVDRLLADGVDPSTIRNTLMPVRAIFRRACRPGGEVVVNPTRGLEIPAAKGKRERIATPAEAEKLIAALHRLDRAIWATAFYGGLRAGELMALDWSCVDLAAGVINVERAYDPVAKQFIDVKSQAGDRRVPIAGVLRDYLVTHKLETGRSHGLVFGSTPETPFSAVKAVDRARRAWARADGVMCGAQTQQGQPCKTLVLNDWYCARHKHLAEPGLEPPKRKHNPILLHEARHTFASLMIAAGVNIKAISTFIGHKSVSTTLDRYGHLMPGSEDEAAARLDAYLKAGHAQARAADVPEPTGAHTGAHVAHNG